LKIKRLSDVCKALKINGLMHGFVLLSHVFGKMARNTKATPKTTPKQQTVENQALERFLWCKLKLLKIKHLR